MSSSSSAPYMATWLSDGFSQPRIYREMRKSQMTPLLWTLAEAGKQMGVSARTVRRILEDGEIPIVRIRHSIRLRSTDVEAYIASRAGQAVPTTGDYTCRSANNENATKMGSSTGQTHRTGGPHGPTPMAKPLADLLKFDAKMIRERIERKKSGRDGS